ncbi:MAG: AAA family ATPase [Deltaproteobacteria bacterium]|nr:AAA family ATPase [Deltaproteobacteria bacterium]
MDIISYEEALIASMLAPDETECTKNIRMLALELPEDRFSGDRKVIYRAILDAYTQNIPIDLLTVAKQLGTSLEKVGGMPELRRINDSLVRLELYTTAGLSRWAEVVDNAGRLRQIHLILQEQAGYLQSFDKACSEIENVDEYLSDLINRLHREQGLLKSGYQHIAQHVDNWERYFELQCQGKVVDRLLTGWPSWDSKTVGLPRGELSILAGLPATGKTQLALQLGYNVASRLKSGCVAFNSLEMTSKKLIDRLACCQAEVDSKKLQAGQLSGDEIARLQVTTDKMRQLPMYIDDSDFLTSGVIGFQASALHSMRDKGPINLLIIDFAELVGDQRTDSEELRVSGIYREAKRIAKNLDTSVLLLAQYNRGVGMRNDKIGTNSDIRYSGMAEIAAGAIMHIYSPWQLHKMGIPVQPPPEMPIADNMAYLIVGKNKDAATGYFALDWNPTYTRWSDPMESNQLGRKVDF